MSVCQLSNALLITSATVIVRFGGLFWLNPVAMVLCMLCSDVLAFEVVMCGEVWDSVCHV